MTRLRGRSKGYNRSSKSLGNEHKPKRVKPSGAFSKRARKSSKIIKIAVRLMRSARGRTSSRTLRNIALRNSENLGCSAWAEGCGNIARPKSARRKENGCPPQQVGGSIDQR